MSLHAPARCLAHELHSIANAEDWNAEVEDVRVAFRRPFGIHAGRATGEDDAFRGNFAHSCRRNIVPHDFAVNMLLAHAARDQLRVL
jgi:hypothetical protein